MNKIFAIADIHGCYTEMMLLYEKIINSGINSRKTKFVWMGDYIDRGPDSKKVVAQLIKWHKQYPHWIFLYGNHEAILRNWIDGKQEYQEDSQWSCFLYNGGKETLKSYGLTEPIRSAIPKAHLDFLFKETKMLYETKDYVFVHAGLVPELPISKHLTKEVYKNAMLWARDGFIDNTWDWGKKVVFGHSPAYKAQWGKFGQPIVMKNKIGIDGAVCPPANKNLIAVELPKEKFYFQKSLA